MSQYFLILIWMGIAALMTGFLKLRRTETVLGSTVERYYPLWAFLIFLPILLMAGLRGNIADTGTYRFSFFKFPATLSEIIPFLETDAKDKGFGVLQIIFKSVFGNNDKLFFFMIAAIQSFALIKVYRKYSENYVLSIFMFVASTAYMAWMFNGMRQFLAVAMTFACTGLILKKKYIPAVIITLLASTIHSSALVIVPTIFVVQGKACNKWTVLLTLAIAALILFGGQLSFLVKNTQYGDVLTTGLYNTDNGANPLRVLFNAITPVLALLFLQKSEPKTIRSSISASTCPLFLSVFQLYRYSQAAYSSGDFRSTFPCTT